MAYRYNYNERSCFEGEDHRDNWDIPSAKAVQDTLVEECDGKIVKSRRQQVAGTQRSPELGPQEVASASPGAWQRRRP